ncbi:hypothetical protein [Arcanobacterium haemolyticum]|uniref:hypothetical protein n=1 Tax=Arcanobacterium haemolyticum TaxID=28264 RepID=UPI000D9CD4E0|nr:hypothetical protein [Arcanobacterium haemolyticum]SPT75213.1 Uncharacterised protein [Arcanobacterium haemolyticum]
MFWKRNNYPRFLHHPSAGMPTAAQQVFGPEAEGSTAEETWIAAWPTFLSIVTATGDRQDYEWFEFESAAWDQESRLLSLTFVDSSQQNRELHLPERADEVLLTMIHERIERSIVCRSSAVLPSGAHARGQIRRKSDETLFVQLIVDSQPLQSDAVALRKMESELRDMAGMSI